MIKLQNDKKDFSGEFLFVAILFIILGALRYSYLFYSGIKLSDFEGQWPFCYYTLKGIDPFSLLGTEIDKTFATTPWGLVLGNVFYPGFLSLETAKIYYFLIFALVSIILAISLYKKFVKENKELACYSVLLLFSSVSFCSGLNMGNASGIICPFLMLAWIFYDKNEYVLGLILGLAMVKPQITLLICFAFLLQKNYKPVLIAAIIDIIGWAVAAVLVDKSMLELMNEFLAIDVAGNHQFSGIFFLFVRDKKITMILSMIFGIIITYFFTNRKANKNNFSFNYTFTASTLWCYSRLYDNYLLLLPAILCMYIMKSCENLYKRIFWLIVALYFNYGAIIANGYMVKLVFGSGTDERIIWALFECGLIVASIFIFSSKEYNEIN